MSREEQLACLLEHWEDATAQGVPLTAEEVCRDAPELLPDFQRLLAKLGAVNAVLQGNLAASPRDLIGRIDAGRYRPVSYLDQGGNGLVFVAEDSELHRTVALKWMQTLPALDPALRKRFLLEAEITAKLDHPGIVPVYGMGRDATGRPFYAMRFIHGETLGDVAKRFHADRSTDAAGRNLEFRRLLQGFVAVCKTIAYAHARGVIHRDLKPGNIMLGPFGETLVLDWGLAKQVDRPNGETPATEGGLLRVSDTASGSTVQGAAAGSPAYMAPEQARGDWGQVGRTTDVYGLGATLYVLLTGRLPFEGRTAPEVMERVKEGRFPGPRQVNPSLARPLAAICVKAMACRPEDRYVSTNELAAEVERWLADEPVRAWREPMLVRARRWVKKHRTLVSTAVGVIFVGAVLLARLAVVLEQKRQETEARRVVEVLEADGEQVLRDLLGLALDRAPRDEESFADPGFRAMIERLGAHYERVLRTHPDPDRFRGAAGLVRYFQARVPPAQLTVAAVRERYERVETDLRDALQHRPDDRLAKIGLLFLCDDLGRFYKSQKAFLDLPRAQERLSEARRLGAELAGDSRAFGAYCLGTSTARLAEVNRETKAVPEQQMERWLTEAIGRMEVCGEDAVFFGEEFRTVFFVLRFQCADLRASLGQAPAIPEVEKLLQEMDHWQQLHPTGFRWLVLKALRTAWLADRFLEDDLYRRASTTLIAAQDDLERCARLKPVAPQTPNRPGPPNLQTPPLEVRYKLIHVRLQWLHAAWSEITKANPPPDAGRRKELAQVALRLLAEREQVELTNPVQPGVTEHVILDVQESRFPKSADAFRKTWWESQASRD